MKKVYIWENVKHLTERWHDGGGAVVVAESVESARKLLPKACSAQEDIPSFGHELCSEELLYKPIENMVFIFPDSGCC